MILFRFIFAISCRLRAMDTLVEQEMDIEGGGFFSVFFFFLLFCILGASAVCVPTCSPRTLTQKIPSCRRR